MGVKGVVSSAGKYPTHAERFNYVCTYEVTLMPRMQPQHALPESHNLERTRSKTKKVLGHMSRSAEADGKREEPFGSADTVLLVNHGMYILRSPRRGYRDGVVPPPGRPSQRTERISPYGSEGIYRYSYPKQVAGHSLKHCFGPGRCREEFYPGTGRTEASGDPPRQRRRDAKKRRTRRPGLVAVFRWGANPSPGTRGLRCR